MADGPDYLYPVSYFDGGLNIKASSHIIGDNESSDNLNCDTNNVGDVQTRYGSRRYGSHTTLPNGTWYGMTAFQPLTGNSQLVGWYNSSMVKLSGTTFITIPSSDGIFNNQTHVVYDVLDGYLCMGDGGTPYKYNGTEFTRLGIEVPSAPAVTTATTAGLLSGIYMYKIANVNSAGIFGDIGSAVTVPLSGAIASMTGIPTAPISHGVNQRYIYRTLTGGSNFFFVTALADNTTTTFKDNTPDTSLITAAPTDQGKPINFSLVKKHKDRLFGRDNVNPATLYYSEVANPYVWKTTNFATLGKGDGAIKKLGIVSDALSVGKNTDENILLYLANNVPANWIEIRSNSPYGSNSMTSVTVEDQEIFLGSLRNSPIGFVGLIGVNPSNEAVSTDIGQSRTDTLSYRIEPDVKSITSTRLNDVQMFHWLKKVYITYPANGTTSGNNRIYVFDYDRRTMPKQIGAWFPWSALSISYFTAYDGRLLGATSLQNGANQVLELNVTDLYSDSGSAIDSYYETKFFGGNKGQDEMHKDFRWLYLYVTLLGSWPMNIYTKTDFDLGVGALQTIDLSTSGSVWDTMVWDTDTWTDQRSEKEFAIDLGKANGRRVKFRFSNQNTAGQAFRVNRAAFEYILRTRRRYNG